MDRALQKLKEEKATRIFTRYGQITQHVQIKDEDMKLKNLAFYRAEMQNNSTMKREKLSKLNQFKLGISDQQIALLKDRQFVIVDKAKLLRKSAEKVKEKTKEQKAAEQAADTDSSGESET